MQAAQASGETGMGKAWRSCPLTLCPSRAVPGSPTLGHTRAQNLG